MAIKRRVERMERAQRRAWGQAMSAAIAALSPEERALCVEGLEAALAGRPVTPAQDEALQKVASLLAQALGADEAPVHGSEGGEGDG